MKLQFDFAKTFPGGQTIRASGQALFQPRLVPAICLMGASGCGKTTFGRWLAGLERGDRGSTLVFGDEIWCDERTFLAPQERRIGYLAQGETLYPHLTVADNIAYGLRRLERGQREARVERLLVLTRLKALHARKPSALSGGQKRRAMLAQVLAIEPRLLFLDEPFTGLDEEGALSLIEDLKIWLRELAIPTFLVTHSRAEASAFGGRLMKFDGFSLTETRLFPVAADGAEAGTIPPLL